MARNVLLAVLGAVLHVFQAGATDVAPHRAHPDVSMDEVVHFIRSSLANAASETAPNKALQISLIDEAIDSAESIPGNAEEEDDQDALVPQPPTLAESSSPGNAGAGEERMPHQLALAEGDSSTSSEGLVFDDSDVDEVINGLSGTVKPPPSATPPLVDIGQTADIDALLNGFRNRIAASAAMPSPPASQAPVSTGPPLSVPRSLVAAAPPVITAARLVVPQEVATVPAVVAAADAGPVTTPRLRGQASVVTPVGASLGGLPGLIILGGNASAASLEEQVTDLFKLGAARQNMGKAAFDATPFGDSIKKIKELTENTMMQKILVAHEANQKQLGRLDRELHKCGSTKKAAVAQADIKKAAYKRFSPLHQTCRAGEAGLAGEHASCKGELKDKAKIQELKCKEFAMVEEKYGTQQANRQIVNKAGSESVESYVDRITGTVCGMITCSAAHIKGGGCGHGGMRDIFSKSKRECKRVTEDHSRQLIKCRRINKQYKGKIKECDSLQGQMDGAACKRAVQTKDACEAYAECHFSKKAALVSFEKMSKQEEVDRKAEWRGLKRMQCLLDAFEDGKVKQEEVLECKKRTHSTKHLVLKYPKPQTLVKCVVPNLYPATPSYKKKEFAHLPVLAKGREDANECAGVQEIATQPANGSPAECKCERVTLNGPYSAGPIVKCMDCLDVRRSVDRNSCPDGTKLFSPRSRMDWKTLLASVTPLRAPHWIVDITRPGNGCGGCSKPMNSKHEDQKTWVTSDGSPWWLRSERYIEPNGDYYANCYLAILQAKTASQITMKDQNCDYHSHSYFCQNREVSLTPKKGSPRSCICKQVVLTGRYSAGALLKCTGCLKVSKSLQKNSCPAGTKLFSPRSRHDWKTFLASAQPLRSPHFIIDVTRPQNGCGGCTKTAMNYKVAAQATWRTADASPWWLRSTRYTEPNGDYHANCYMDLWQPAPNEDSVAFDDKRCAYHSTAYYCQTAAVKKKRAPPSPPPPPSSPPRATSGGSYKGFKCAAVGKYTGLSKPCGAWKPLTKSQCWAKCKQSAPAQDTKSCNKVHGLPKCVAMVWNAKKRICNLYRSCQKLVKAHPTDRTQIKATYKPSAKVFLTKKNEKCKGKPFTEGPNGCKAPDGITQKECAALCSGNRYVENCPLKQCAAAVFHHEKGRCELFEKCSKMTKAVGASTLKKKL